MVLSPDSYHARAQNKNPGWEIALMLSDILLLLFLGCSSELTFTKGLLGFVPHDASSFDQFDSQFRNWSFWIDFDQGLRIQKLSEEFNNIKNPDSGYS